MKIFLKIGGIVLGMLILALVGLIIFATITKYSPAEKKFLYNSGSSAILLLEDAELSLMTWNIGYAGLGDDMDFFYDGGKKMRTTHDRTLNNYSFIIEYLKKNNYKDFILLQEVDKNSRRSYNINILGSLKRLLPDANIIYGKNYDVRYVPLPVFSPMGSVNSGLVTISFYETFVSERHSYQGEYPWPNNLFNLQRCFTLNRYHVENGRELVIINTHNSAFDKGDLRKKQMNHLKEVLKEEYRKGNYVIAGGDWNQCPPQFNPEFHFNLFDTLNLMYIPDDFLPEWQYAYDSFIPTNRRLLKPYDPANTLTTLIDFFIVSPNIEIINVEGIHLDFKHSDHNPVKLKIKLLGDKTIKPVEYIGR